MYWYIAVSTISVNSDKLNNIWSFFIAVLRHKVLNRSNKDAAWLVIPSFKNFGSSTLFNIKKNCHGGEHSYMLLQNIDQNLNKNLNIINISGKNELLTWALTSPPCCTQTSIISRYASSRVKKDPKKYCQL